MITIERAEATDLPEVTDALASAFAHDPLFRWITGARDHTSIEPALRVLFGAMADQELADPPPHGHRASWCQNPLMRIVCVTIDSREPISLAEFWNAALRWGGVAAAPDGGGAICGPADGGMYLEFVRVPEPKTVKNRLHLGCTAGSVEEFDAEFDRLVSLGAELAWREDFGGDVDAYYRNWVLRDPEGNEFCLGGGSWPEGVDPPSEVPATHP